MSTQSIVALLIAERDKLNRAIEALRSNGEPSTEAHAITETAAPKKRFISAGTRRKMALGQKKRYAALKAAAKK
jgi:hypothetical protein